jgi:hypothetical protein
MLSKPIIASCYRDGIGCIRNAKRAIELLLHVRKHQNNIIWMDDITRANRMLDHYDNEDDDDDE